MSRAISWLPGPVTRFYDWLPTGVDRRVRFMVWLSLAIEILIVATGGAVRLTASGLGCPTWPQCTAGSFVTTPEMGIHGVIEFGNRLLFFVIQVVAILTLLFIVKYRKQRRDMFVLAIVPCFSIVLQAVLGGITVLTNLNPYVVGLHFLASVVLVVLASVLVFRTYYGKRGTTLGVPGWFAGIVHTTSFFALVTIVLGIITTGSGPHAGDGGASRNGLDSELLQHFHSWPAYATFALTIAVVVLARRFKAARILRFGLVLFAVEVAQIIVGLTQARLGLPEILVGLHMVLACMLAAAMTAVVLSLRSAVAPVVPLETAQALDLTRG